MTRPKTLLTCALLATATISGCTAFASTNVRTAVHPARITNSTPSKYPSRPSLTTSSSVLLRSTSSSTDEETQASSTPGFLRKSFPHLPWHQLPNALTGIRCLSIPILMYLFYQPHRRIATFTVFALASLTDWLDGFLARQWQVDSPFGAFLDPVADKLMVSSCLILLTSRYGMILAVPSCIILAREIAVSALREWMAQRGERDSVQVGMQGKIKTALTMVAISILLLASSVESRFYLSGLVLTQLSALITVTSGFVYFRAAAPLLMGKR